MGGFLKALLVIGVAFALFTFPATWLLMSMVRTVVGGVDTHADVHVAAAVESNGGVLGIESFPTDTAGYEALAGWLAAFGPVLRVGVEGTGSYGVGLSRFLHDLDVDVVEVNRANRQARRKEGSPQHATE
ncbi:MAG: IS110 family transposase [Acidimicrobiia bacterium]|nr:IS110 family transposase [Acidimicrobiia bacterium]